jgi:uncharacterized protein YehS (DUF1456 family)
MTHNDILRRIRYILDYDDATMVAVFAAAGRTVTQERIKDWLVGDENPRYVKCGDEDLAVFLNGLINTRRGKRLGPPPVPEKRLINNTIVMKLRIALNLQGEDMIRILDLGGVELSNHELSAFFRKPDHKHYRLLKDQVMRCFMRGLQMELRPGEVPDAEVDDGEIDDGD